MTNGLQRLAGVGNLCFILSGCMPCYNPTGCNYDDSPYFMVQKLMVVRQLPVPPGTQLRYQQQYFWQKNAQAKPLPMTQLTDIIFPANQNILWGGVPVSRISQFFNSEMRGYSVTADLSRSVASTEFVRLWKLCDAELDIEVKNTQDWSFHPGNMQIIGCGINIQRRSQYNDHNPEQAKVDEFLAKINAALQALPVQTP